jgi:hypothetical protein
MLLWPLAMLFLTMPEVTVSDDAVCRPPPREFLSDTNVYVCPPAISGRVVWTDVLGGYTKYPGAIGYGVYDSRHFSAHGYASFDLGDMPDSIDVLSVRLWYYQYDHGRSFEGDTTPWTDLTLIPDANAPAQQVFRDISNGVVIDTLLWTPNGWAVRPLNSIGVAAVDSCRVRGESLNLGVRGGWCCPGAAYGAGPYHPLRAHLGIQYSTTSSYCDVVALDVTFDSFPLVVGDPIHVTGHVVNTGNQTALAVPVCVSCTGTAGDTFMVDSLAPDETTCIRLSLPPVAQPGIASLVLCSDVQGDWCRHNDTAIKSAYVFPDGTRSAVDFEPEHSPAFPPLGWFVSNGGDTNTWYRAGPGDRYAHTDGYYATSVGNDDWLITYGLAPRAGVADTMGFFMSASGGLQVWALASQDPYNTIGLLLDTIFAAGWLEVRVGLDQYDGRSVYLGFRTYAHGRACLDDIWFTSERVPAVEGPTSGQTPALKLGLGQNPVTGNRVVILYQTPNPGPLLVEVADALGRTVARQRLPIALGSGQVYLATHNWPAGMYFFRVKAGAASASLKCVVHRRNP